MLLLPSHGLARFVLRISAHAGGPEWVLPCRPDDHEGGKWAISRSEHLEARKLKGDRPEITRQARVEARSYRRGRRDRCGCGPRARPREGDGRLRRDGWSDRAAS